MLCIYNFNFRIYWDADGAFAPTLSVFACIAMLSCNLAMTVDAGHDRSSENNFELK